MNSSDNFPRIAKPCPGCPWRVDKDATDIPNFSLAKAEALANTSPCEKGFGPSFSDGMFACHQSYEGKEFACAGWLATVGHAHPMVRLAIATGSLSSSALEPSKGWPELHDDFQQVIAKLRATASPGGHVEDRSNRGEGERAGLAKSNEKTITLADICRLNDLPLAKAESALDTLQRKGLIRGFVPGDMTAPITLTPSAAKYIDFRPRVEGNL